VKLVLYCFISPILSLCQQLQLKVMLQFGVSLTDDSRGVTYNGNVFILHATGRLSRHDTLTVSLWPVL